MSQPNKPRTIVNGRFGVLEKMNSATPITIIGGYLGTGKTTLINHLLRHADGVRLAVLVNDFGELPIDAELIEAQEGDVISLSGGCVCCSYGDDLSLALQKLQSAEPLPEHIFIEASGVALPGAIGRSLSLHRDYLLEGIVVLADAKSVQINANKKYIADTIERQLADADLVLLNMMDLLSNSEASSVREWFAQNYADARLIETAFSSINPKFLFEVDGRRHASAHACTSAHTSHHAESYFSSITLNIEQPTDAHALASKLASKDCDLVRAKGFVIHTDQTRKLIQVVGRRWSVTDVPTGERSGIVCIACSADLSAEKIQSVCNLSVIV